MSKCDERPVDTGACNCCGDAELLNRIEQLQTLIQELREKLSLLETEVAQADTLSFTSCGGLAVARNEALATCADFNIFREDIENRLRRTDRFRNCSGQFLPRDAMLATCSDIEALRQDIQSNSTEINNLRRLINKLRTDLDTLKEKVGQNLGGSIDQNKITEILNRLKELEDCCANNSGGGQGGDCDFDGWEAGYTIRRTGANDDRRYTVQLFIHGPPRKAFTITGPGEFGQVAGVIGADGQYYYSKMFFETAPTGQYEIIHCGRAVVTGVLRVNMP